jgi:hypothetical protein
MGIQGGLKRMAMGMALSLTLAAGARAEGMPELGSYALDAQGNVLLASSETDEVLRIQPGGVVEVVAELAGPRKLGVDAEGTIYV